MKLFSRKKDVVIGVDVSATAIKLVELSKKKKGYSLTAFANIPLPRDAIVENTVIDSIAVSQALLDAIEASGTKIRNTAIAVSGNALIVKVIQVPSTTELELESQIMFEADQHVPFEIDDVYSDFQILGENEDDPEMMDVVLVACKREIVDDYQLVLSEAGLNTSCVDCAVFAIENAAEELGLLDLDSTEADAEEALDDDFDSTSGAVALVNIGANIININILREGQMSFVRDQFYGGQNLTEMIQKAHAVSFNAAEEMKKDNFSEVDPNAIEEFYSGLSSEIGRSLDFYGANNAEYPVQTILLSGGCALIPNIDVELYQRLGIETRVFNPFDYIEVSDVKLDAEAVKSVGPMMVVPVGLAMRSFDQ